MWGGGPFIGTKGYRRGFVGVLRIECGYFMQHAKALFATNPIAEVTLTDKRPHEWSGAFWWACDGTAEGTSVLPKRIHRLLSGFSLYPTTNTETELPKRYADEKTALQDLSDVCVEHGRQLNGLPSLRNASVSVYP